MTTPEPYLSQETQDALVQCVGNHYRRFIRDAVRAKRISKADGQKQIDALNDAEKRGYQL